MGRKTRGTEKKEQIRGREEVLQKKKPPQHSSPKNALQLRTRQSKALRQDDANSQALQLEQV